VLPSRWPWGHLPLWSEARGGTAPEGLNLGILQMGVPAAAGSCGRGRSAHRNDPTRSPRLPRRLGGAAGAGRAAARSGGPRWEETCRPSDASRRADRGLPPSQASRLEPDTATHEDLVKRHFRADAPDRLWFCRHHPTPREGRVGLRRRGDRRVLPMNRGLVDLGSDHCGDRRRRPRDGPLASQAPTRGDRPRR